jgi:hypothetical protein
MSQLLMQGTEFVNFFGRHVYVADGAAGLEAVPVTERKEPQAVYGSHLHSLAYPEKHERFVKRGRDLKVKDPAHDAMYHHRADLGHRIQDLQKRGEYLYTARGDGGFYAYDIANIANKGFSQRIQSAPVSPLGQDLGFDTEAAVAVAAPTTLALDPGRTRVSDDPEKPRATLLDERKPWHPNMEQQAHPLYAYIYVGDRKEGLILTKAGTLLDGDPENNFLERAELADGTTAFNPHGVLDGLTNLTVAGHYVYATTKDGLVVLDIDEPLNPKVVASLEDGLKKPRDVQVQFRYAFVTDIEGLKVLDVTHMDAPKLVPEAGVALEEAHQLYVARTKALVAAGAQGLAVIDVEKPEQPTLETLYDADGRITDARDVKAGMTNASLYGYVADGAGGLKVLQLMGPNTTPQFRGFAPPLDPRLIAHKDTAGPALAISKGLDRDRAVDETGNQLAVFGRVGARPLSRKEMRRMYIEDGELWQVTNEPETEPEPFTHEPEKDEDKKAPPPGASGGPGGGSPPGGGGGPPR